MSNKFLVILVGVLMVIAIVGYIMWGFVLNYAFVTFVGDSTYSITLDGKTSVCDRVCEFKVLPGDHSYALSLEGYRDIGGMISVDRWNKEFVQVDFVFVPKVGAPQQYSIFKLPAGYANYNEVLRQISLFTSFDSDFVLKKLPKKLDNMVFSEDGKNALVFSDGTISTYLVDESMISQLDGFESASNGDFTQEGDEFYTISFDDEVQKSVLRKVNFDDGSFVDLVFFNRDVIDYDLRVSPNQKYVALVDKTFTPAVMYLINLDKSMRTNVYEGSSIRLGNFSKDDNYIVFEARNITEDFPNLKYLDTQSQTISEFLFKADIEEFDFTDDGYGYFITDSEEGDTEIRPEDLLNSTTPIETLMLKKWDPQMDEVFDVLELEEYFDARPDRLEVSSDSKLIRFLIGDKLYDLKIRD